jgi:hypothetical protein
MAGERATTIRFSDSMYQRLEAAGELTGLPINSIVVVACLEWLDAHQTEAAATGMPFPPSKAQAWAKNLIPLGMRKGTFPFDRFSAQAKEALLMAQEEAEKHRQGYIGPEHLLLGLLRVKTGFAATVLPSLGIDAAVVEAKLESPQDKSPIQRLIPTSRTKRVIETAFRLASDMQHRCVGTGHLLLGLITEADGATVAVFMEKEVTPDRIAAEVQRLQGTVGPED